MVDVSFIKCMQNDKKIAKKFIRNENVKDKHKDWYNDKDKNISL